MYATIDQEMCIRDSSLALGIEADLVATGFCRWKRGSIFLSFFGAACFHRWAGTGETGKLAVAAGASGTAGAGGLIVGVVICVRWSLKVSVIGTDETSEN